MELLQLWVRGDNHLLIRGPLMSFAETGLAFQALEVPTIDSLLQKAKCPSHSIVTQAFREDIEVYCVLPSAAAHSAAVETLLGELRARGVPKIQPTELS